MIALGEAHHAVLGMKLGIDTLDHITNQCRIIIQFTKCAKHAIAIGVAGQYEVLPPPHPVWEGGVSDAIFDSAASGHVRFDGRFLSGEFHVDSPSTK